jgi:hypothetical protein
VNLSEREERIKIRMKECAWCGDDFRGQGFVLDGNYFCSEECMEEWRKDVQPGETTEPVIDSEAGPKGEEASEASRGC